MRQNMAACKNPVVSVCFVDDEVILRKIRNYTSDANSVPMKKSRKSLTAKPSRARESLVVKEKQPIKPEKENKTPRRASRRYEIQECMAEQPKEQDRAISEEKLTQKPDSENQSPGQMSLRSRKPVVHIQKVLATQNKNNEDSESNDESAAESGASDIGSTDDEIQFKPQDDSTSAAKNSSEVKTKLSKLKEMAEAYFAVHHNKKIVTSDRTLSRLQNPRMTQKDLQMYLSDSSVNHKYECDQLFKEYVNYFPKWMFQLRHGFNILLHGLGSKRRLLDEFRKSMLADSVHIVVNGFFPSLTIKSILNMITEDLLNYSGSFKNIIDQCNFIKSEYNSEEADELFLLLHNIDGPMLRNSKAQNALSYLACSSKIHVVASIDHINAPVVWDENRSSRFNWLWYDTTTFDRYTEETSFENSLLIQQTGSLALSSLTHVLRSLTPNARGIFRLLVKYQLENDSDSNYIGISFADLYQKCREKFLVNSDLTLRAQLTEFRDHKLIKFKKGGDGVENLSIPLNSTALKQFMEDNDL